MLKISVRGLGYWWNTPLRLISVFTHPSIYKDSYSFRGVLEC